MLGTCEYVALHGKKKFAGDSLVQVNGEEC